MRIGEVYKNVTVTADYGSMKIDNMTSNAGDVSIDSDYMKITIGYSSGYNFDFDLDLSYGSLRGDENLEFSKRVEKSSNKKYSGYHGSKGSGNTINITSDNGSVTFNKN